MCAWLARRLRSAVTSALKMALLLLSGMMKLAGLRVMPLMMILMAQALATVMHARVTVTSMAMTASMALARPWSSSLDALGVDRW